jgi:5-methylcytosine-specific restriction endonuclease McrA
MVGTGLVVSAAAPSAESLRDRTPIPPEIRRLVWQRDGGRCVQCGADHDLQLDHIIPVSKGGATTVDNLQILCGPCNRRKSATI